MEKKFTGKNSQFRFWTSLIMGWTTRRKTQVILLLFELIVIPFLQGPITNNNLDHSLSCHISVLQKEVYLSPGEVYLFPFPKTLFKLSCTLLNHFAVLLWWNNIPHPVLILSTFPHVTKSFLHSISSFIPTFVYYFPWEGLYFQAPGSPFPLISK